MRPRPAKKPAVPNVIYIDNHDDSLPFVITKVESIHPKVHLAFINGNIRVKEKESKEEASMKTFPKPPYSYACLIAMSLKNSKSGGLPVSGIYQFLCTHFPYFQSAPKGWKEQIRSYLKTKYFEKRKTPGFTKRTGNWWMVNPAMKTKFDDEIRKWSQRNPAKVKKALLHPENLEKMERGELVMDFEDFDEQM
jgi:hypothetical protein